MATKPPLTLEAMITTTRIAKPWSLQQLGDAVGTVCEGDKAVSPQFINVAEHDRHKPSTELLHAFVNILHLDIDVLHCVTGEDSPLINVYLQAHPQTRPESTRLLRHSKEKQFSD